ncbi:unnamed protein product [Peronospora belbahrii]|uniref:Uncharacterized protein n=1 Tax=Peronospora belbahrii TaxID=622444 RepID=A0ABN8CNY8_9STRA|nr:unnamed protein product [Peronospora belbahrii]
MKISTTCSYPGYYGHFIAKCPVQAHKNAEGMVELRAVGTRYTTYSKEYMKKKYKFISLVDVHLADDDVVQSVRSGRHKNIDTDSKGIIRSLLSDCCFAETKDVRWKIEWLQDNKTPNDLFTELFGSTFENTKKNLDSREFATWINNKKSFDKVYSDDQAKLFKIINYSLCRKDNRK